MALPENTVLADRYRIDRLLSYGGMGAIYRAFDTNLKTWVAIKENVFQTTHSIRQFEQEALILARLRHPGLPRVIHHFSFDQKQYLVMDFIEGQDLWEMVRQQGYPLEEEQALTYLIQICEAVVYLHRQIPPIIHRDIKPQNIKITPDNQAVLVDFGIAKVADDESGTRTGAQAITPGFSPPEQYGKIGTTPVSDVYSLGATLYAVLVGKKPPDSVSRMVGGIKYEPPHTLNPKLSREVSATIEYAMQVRQADRPQSVEAWQKDLEDVLSGATVLGAAPVDATELPTVMSPVGNEAIGVETDSLPLSTRSPEGVPTEDIPKPRSPWSWILLGIVVVGGLLAGGGWYLNTVSTNQRINAEAIVAAALTAAVTAQVTVEEQKSVEVDPEATVNAMLTAAVAEAQNKEETRQAREVAQATATPLPPTPTPTPLPPIETPTPAVPSVTVNTDINIRTGPGMTYDVLGTLSAGTTTEIVGRNQDQSWWQINYSNGPDGTGWISADLGEAENTDTVAVAAIPPTPTAVPVAATPTPNWGAVDNPPYCPVYNHRIIDPAEISSPYTDIVQVSSSLSGQSLTVSFIVSELPEMLTFNREGVLRGHIEYSWSTYVDIDANFDTGVGGAEYVLEAKTIVGSGSVPPYELAVAVGAPAEVWQCDADGHCRSVADAHLVVVPESNELIITGDIPGITTNSRLVFVTVDYFAGYDWAGCAEN